MGRDGHFMKAVDPICDDDDGARKHARKMVDGHDVEHWQHSCRIKKFEGHSNSCVLWASRNRRTMSEVERLREQADKCRQLARLSGDIEIERRLTALADEFEAKAAHARAQANCGNGDLPQKRGRPRSMQVQGVWVVSPIDPTAATHRSTKFDRALSLIAAFLVVAIIMVARYWSGAHKPSNCMGETHRAMP